MEIIVEVCDPPGGAQWAYTVNGYLMSDFVTPAYYDPVGAPGVRYSFTGAVTRPREMLEGGYMSWRDPATGEWWQGERATRTEVVFRNIGRLDEDGRPIRERIDQFTADDPALHGDLAQDQPLRDAKSAATAPGLPRRRGRRRCAARMADLGLS